MEALKMNSLCSESKKVAIDVLKGYIVDCDGVIADIPVEMELRNIQEFINVFQQNYLIFRNDTGETLFEVSEGIICHVNEESGLSKRELVQALYRNGLRIVR